MNDTPANSCTINIGPVTEELDVTVVMPCLNEALTVGKCITKAMMALQGLGVRGEVVIADNGSVDGSQEIARKLGARVLTVERRGYGSALRAGILSARGRYIVMGDSDDSYDFTRLAPFIARLEEGNDLVIGNRFLGGILPGAMPWLHRYVGNPILTGLLNFFYRSPIRDAHCGLRAFRKESYLKLDLRASGMEFASEMVIKACLHRQRVVEIPVILHPDGRDRLPHLRSFRDGWRHLRFLLLLCPTWLYLVPSCLMMAIGLSLMAWLTLGPQKFVGVMLGPHTMILGSLCLILGYQTLWLWAFAKIHGWLSGLLPSGKFANRVFDNLYLERGIAIGIFLLVLGFGLNLSLLHHWKDTGFGALDVGRTIPVAVWGCTAISIGVQTINNSFFLSMLDMTNNDKVER